MEKLIYMRDATLKSIEAVVEEVHNDEGRLSLEFDRTIFYPKGGGQPSDRGVVKSGDVLMNVLMVNINRETGQVFHFGEVLGGQFKKGDRVELTIDWDLRYQNSRIHSYGHLLDAAVHNLGITLEPGSGFHYSEGPYVEYLGEVTQEQIQYLEEKLPHELERLIALDEEVKILFVDISELSKYCRWLSPTMPKSEKIRIVEVSSGNWIACGGTHVQRVSELKSMVVRKIRYKKNTLKISYE